MNVFSLRYQIGGDIDIDQARARSQVPVVGDGNDSIKLEEESTLLQVFEKHLLSRMIKGNSLTTNKKDHALFEFYLCF